MRYKVITEKIKDEFLASVNEHLDNGWQLAGGVSFIVDRYVDSNGWAKVNEIYNQAMVKADTPIGVLAQGIASPE